MVELDNHCHTHIVPRLQKVINGQDPGGVTQATNWQSGGGFRYYELAPTLLATDRWGNLVINPEYDAPMLTAAMCKPEGFSYAPSEVLWWQQDLCEWGHDDYSLNVTNLPMAQAAPKPAQQDDLFGEADA